MVKTNILLLDDHIISRLLDELKGTEVKGSIIRVELSERGERSVRGGANGGGWRDSQRSTGASSL